MHVTVSSAQPRVATNCMREEQLRMTNGGVLLSPTLLNQSKRANFSKHGKSVRINVDIVRKVRQCGS